MVKKHLRRLIWTGCGLAVLALVAGLVWTWGEAAPAKRPVEWPTGGYIGSAACRNCHANQHGSWYDSYHRTMTQAATEQSVLGNFDNVRMSGKDLAVRLFKHNGQFLVDLTLHRPEVSGVYPVVLTTGSHYRQAYWMFDRDSSQLMILPYMYLKAERRWIPRHAGYVTALGEHETPEKAIFKGEYGRWAFVCIKCHTTHPEPAPTEPTGNSLALSRVAEFGISCEACHGPGGQHVRVKVAADAGEEAPGGAIVNPASLPHDRSAQVCGQCHAVFASRTEEAFNDWRRNGDSFRPGDDLLSHPLHFIVRGRADLMPNRPAHVEDPETSGSFWPDGMIRATGREFNGLIESPCYKRGQMSCLSCHQMHQKTGDPRPRAEWAAGQLKPGMDGNRACLQCHDRFAESGRLRQHTHHAADSPGSNCYNCHMPNTTYGILKATRSHQVSSPGVEAGLQAARPNACNQCHQDRTLAWTADHLADWYKQLKPRLSTDEVEVSASVRWALCGDAGQRAIAAWTFGWPEAHQASGNNWQGAFLAQLLDDPSAAVRFIAERSLKRLPGFAEFDCDFVGPPEARSAASKRAREIWEHSRRGGKRPFARETLLDAEGRVLDSEFQRLLKLRDDHPVEIAE